MNWTKIPIESIVTKNVIYFDEAKEGICRRICKNLAIDCLPALTGERYWELKNEQFNECLIDYSPVLSSISNAFDNNLLEMFEKNNGKVIFTTNECQNINGVIHFTNFDSKAVFSVLYQNIHVFERNLRLLLHSQGHSYTTFINYYEEKKSKSKGNKRERYEEKIKQLGKEDLKNLMPLERLEFKELLEYSISSSFHSEIVLKEIGLKTSDLIVNCETLGDLRNTVMHSKNVKGANVFVPYNFEKFKTFFIAVNEFYEVFNQLYRSISINKQETQKLKNESLLMMLDNMSELALNNYFYSNF